MLLCIILGLFFWTIPLSFVSAIYRSLVITHRLTVMGQRTTTSSSCPNLFLFCSFVSKLDILSVFLIMVVEIWRWEQIFWSFYIKMTLCVFFFQFICIFCRVFSLSLPKTTCSKLEKAVILGDLLLMPTNVFRQKKLTIVWLLILIFSC